MTQGPDEKEQTLHLAEVAIAGLAYISAALFLSIMIPTDPRYAMVNFTLRASIVGVMGIIVVGGIYVGFDWIYPGSLSADIAANKVAPAVLASSIILAGVLLMFAS